MTTSVQFILFRNLNVNFNHLIDRPITICVGEKIIYPHETLQDLIHKKRLQSAHIRCECLVILQYKCFTNKCLTSLTDKLSEWPCELELALRKH